jgi:hypothetical protein
VEPAAMRVSISSYDPPSCNGSTSERMTMTRIPIQRLPAWISPASPSISRRVRAIWNQSFSQPLRRRERSENPPNAMRVRRLSQPRHSGLRAARPYKTSSLATAPADRPQAGRAPAGRAIVISRCGRNSLPGEGAERFRIRQSVRLQSGSSPCADAPVG